MIFHKQYIWMNLEEIIATPRQYDWLIFVLFFNHGQDHDFLLKRGTWFVVLMLLKKIRCGLRINSAKCKGTQTGNLVFVERLSTYSLKLLCCRVSEQRTSQRMKWRGNTLDKLMKLLLAGITEEVITRYVFSKITSLIFTLLF